MIDFESEHNYEENENQVFIDLTDQITYLFDDAFYRMLQNGRGLAEFVQTDAYSMQDDEMYAILISETGGKADKGAEQIRLLARKNGDFDSIYDAADSMINEGQGLAYNTGEYFIAHQSDIGEWRFNRVDDYGLYPWLPHLRDVILDDNQLFNNFEAVDVSELEDNNDDVQDDQFRQLDIAYAEELIDKLDRWYFIPNN